MGILVLLIGGLFVLAAIVDVVGPVGFWLLIGGGFAVWYLCKWHEEHEQQKFLENMTDEEREEHRQRSRERRQRREEERHARRMASIEAMKHQRLLEQQAEAEKKARNGQLLGTAAKVAGSIAVAAITGGKHRHR